MVYIIQFYTVPKRKFSQKCWWNRTNQVLPVKNTGTLTIKARALQSLYLVAANHRSHPCVIYIPNIDWNFEFKSAAS